MKQTFANWRNINKLIFHPMYEVDGVHQIDVTMLTQIFRWEKNRARHFSTFLDEKKMFVVSKRQTDRCWIRSEIRTDNRVALLPEDIASRFIRHNLNFSNQWNSRS